MADNYTIISLALQKLGVTGALKAPSQSDLDLGLTTLQSLYRQLISNGALGRARPVTACGDYTARENDRILRTSSDRQDITLPMLVAEEHDNDSWDDYQIGYSGSSRRRPPRDGSFVIINDAASGYTEEYIYEAYVAKWISLHDLSTQQYEEVRDTNNHVVSITPASIAPLSFRDQNGLAAYLATKLADYYGGQLYRFRKALTRQGFSTGQSIDS